MTIKKIGVIDVTKAHMSAIAVNEQNVDAAVATQGMFRLWILQVEMS